MPVYVEQIKFDHGPGGSLHIRKNFSEATPNPEWVRGRSSLHQDSPAAYAWSEVAGNSISVQARFSNDEGLDALEIRAVDVDASSRPGGCLGLILLFFPATAHGGSYSNILGDLSAQRVAFRDGQSEFVSFFAQPLTNHNPAVRVDNITWRWEYRPIGSSKWQPLGQKPLGQSTNHRIYWLLSLPQSPWSQEIGMSNLPWTDALDYACTWARFSGTHDDAAIRITQALNGLGILQYNPFSHYTDRGTFYCSDFLAQLRYGAADPAAGRSYKVNCSDCACAVSTFSNVLGCDLYQIRIYDGHYLDDPDPDSREFAFDLNPIVPIGGGAWRRGVYGNFLFHEAAWKLVPGMEEMLLDATIFDSCLCLDGDSDPTSPPHSNLSPVNIPFGRSGDNTYFDRLVAPTRDSRDRCRVQPSTQNQRRLV